MIQSRVLASNNVKAQIQRPLEYKQILEMHQMCKES